MIDWRRIVAVVVWGLFVTAVVDAGMVSVSPKDNDQRLAQVNARTEITFENFNNISHNFGVANMDMFSGGFSPEATVDISLASKTDNPRILTSEPDSLSLCLSALVGLGLCSSGHWVKKLSFGFVPEWYHEGGPGQIGHSHAVMPEFLCNSQVCCFIQPVFKAEEQLSQYHLKTIASLWRKSQFTPAVIASRGPPVIS